jgi:hypothetical protein
MARIVSLSLDEKTFGIYEKIPKRNRSKFIRNAIQSQGEFLADPKMIVFKINTGQLELYELINYTKKLKNICEAQSEK